MEQQLVPDSEKVDGLAANKRMGWFMTAIFVLVLSAAGSLAWFNVRMAENTLKQHTQQELLLVAQNKSMDLSLWFRSIQEQVTRLVHADLFRLFASEVAALGDAPLVKLKAAEQQANQDSELAQLAAQIPLMENLLQEFVTLSEFTQAQIFNTKGQLYLTSDMTQPALTQAQEEALQRTVQTGTFTVLPVRGTPQDLVLDLMFPLQSPRYVQQGGEVVAGLFLTVKVSDRLKAALAAGNDELGATRILQTTGPLLEELMPFSNTLRQIPGWRGPVDALYGFGERRVFSVDPMYTIGVNIPELPWFVSQEVPVKTIEKTLRAERNSILIRISMLVVVVSLTLLAVWWWLVGRSARSINAEILRLYRVVSEQKQLLDGINSTLADGIVLTDTAGVVRYANTSFTHMVGRSGTEIVGMDCSALFGYDTALRLYRYLDAASEQEKEILFNDTIWLQSKKHHFQVTCAPYRNELSNVMGVVSVFRDTTQLVEAQERSQRMIRQTIDALMLAIETVDPYLSGHSAVMAAVATEIAQEMGLEEKDKATVSTAAKLSQIGKLRLPRELLTKPGAFTPEERHLMEQHVHYAHAALKNVNFELPIMEAVYQMNELTDGSGYPERLQGEAIGIHGRVLAVANTFCALIRPRAYRNATSVSEALAFFDERTTKYDPCVVAALKVYLATPAGEKFIAALGERV